MIFRRCRKLAASVLAGLMLVPALASAHPAEEGDAEFHPVLTQEEAAALKERVEAENARAAVGTTFAWYSDEEYAAGLVPADIAERVIEPDDGGCSDSAE